MTASTEFDWGEMKVRVFNPEAGLVNPETNAASSGGAYGCAKGTHLRTYALAGGVRGGEVFIPGDIAKISWEHS